MSEASRNTTEIKDAGSFDALIVGGGGAGIMAALFAARGGARMALVERAERLGGCLLVANGQMSAAGTRLQREQGIADSADLHFEDVMRISRGTADPALVRLAVENAATTFDWLCDQGFTVEPGHPVLGNSHEPYSRPRYYWSRERGHAVLACLEPLLAQQVGRGAISLWCETGIDALRFDAAGRVSGALGRDAQGERLGWSAPRVVLATGGYSANAALYEKISGVPQHCAMAYPHAQGIGHEIAVQAGGYLRGIENLFTNFGFPLERLDVPSRPVARVVTDPALRVPWEIYVNAAGARFVREDDASVDSREQALLRQPGHRYWIVFDQAMLERAEPILSGWSREAIAAQFAKGHPSFHKAGSLAELARVAGIDAQGLRASVAAYNAGVESGEDALGRRHLPAPIAQGPFYAIRQQGCTISSAAGLAVDIDLQVLREDGSAIEGLHAIGEILGAGQTMGKAACGGMMITPALTFGRLLGERIARERRA